MPLQFACNSCQQMLAVSSRKVGAEVNCPRCNARIVVPTAELAAAAVALRKLSKPAPAVEELPAFGPTVSGPEPNLSDVIVYDDVAAAIDEPPPGPARSFHGGPVAVDPNLVAIPRKLLYAQAALIAVLGLTTFGLGFLIGRARPAPTAAAPAEPVEAAGQASYRSPAGGALPDAGAVVIALPADAAPPRKARLRIDGLRPADPPPGDDNSTIPSLELIDGGYARAGDDGKFSFMLRPGKYMVLAISRHAGRRPGVGPRPEHLAALSNYFNPAIELIADRQYRLLVKNIPGDDLSFDFAADGQ